MTDAAIKPSDEVQATALAAYHQTVGELWAVIEKACEQMILAGGQYKRDIGDITETEYDNKVATMDAASALAEEAADLIVRIGEQEGGFGASLANRAVAVNAFPPPNSTDPWEVVRVLNGYVAAAASIGAAYARSQVDGQ